MVYDMVRMLRKLKQEMNKAKMQLFEEGRDQGLLEGRIEVAKKLLLNQISMQNVAEYTGLPMEQLASIETGIAQLRESRSRFAD